jgi:hypothetical protein
MADTEQLAIIAFFIIRNICSTEDQCHIYRKHGIMHIHLGPAHISLLTSREVEL